MTSGLVRAEGIEPSIQAWEAHVLPLYYARESDGVKERSWLRLANRK